MLKCSGLAYAYEASISIPIYLSAGDYHALTGLSLGGDSVNCTLVSSLTAAVASVADNGSGKMRCTSVGHGFSTGDFACMNNASVAAYNVITTLTYITDDTFDTTVNYDSDVTLNVTRGSGLKIAAGCGGPYKAGFGFFGTLAAANKAVKVELVKNATEIDTSSAIQGNDATVDHVALSSACTQVQLAGGDVLWAVMANQTDAVDFTLVMASVTLSRNYGG